MNDELVAIYTAGDEAGRLGRPSDIVEWRRSLEVIESVLPGPGALVADVGGGPGRYARHLAERGYRVMLVDLVPAHVAQAAAAAIPAAIGDACALPLPSGAVDVVLLQGPLYHLPDAAGRHSALTEARRVLRPGGRIVAAGLSRVGRAIVTAVDGLDEATAWTVVTMLADGRVAPAAIWERHVYRHTSRALRDEVTGAGFTDVTIVGVEGPLGAWARRDPDLADAALDAARLTDDPDCSIHMLATATAPRV